MKRPITVTLVSGLFIVAGIAGIVYHASEWKSTGIQQETIWAFAVRVIAIAAGFFTLRGSNFARWTLTTWMVYHVGLSLFHSTAELIVHVFFGILTAFALFNVKANLFFTRARD